MDGTATADVHAGVLDTARRPHSAATADLASREPIVRVLLRWLWAAGVIVGVVVSHVLGDHDARVDHSVILGVDSSVVAPADPATLADPARTTAGTVDAAGGVDPSSTTLARALDPFLGVQTDTLFYCALALALAGAFLGALPTASGRATGHPDTAPGSPPGADEESHHPGTPPRVLLCVDRT